MAKKPTYKELEQRVRKLEKKFSKHKRGREALGEFREFKEKIISESPIGMSMYDSSGQCVAANDSVGELIGATKEQVLEQNYNNIESWKKSGMLDKAKSAIRENSKKRHELSVKSTFGKDVSLDCHLVPFLSEGQLFLLVMINDITERLRAETALEARTTELEELNSALRVLLKQRDKDKTELEEKVMLNVKELILPYIEKFKGRHLDAKSMAYLSVMESNLNDIVSPFVHKLSSKHSSLTPTEIQIAYLVRDGRTAKETAELLNLSRRTIESHRQNIRMKVGLHGKKANLRSHLLSM